LNAFANSHYGMSDEDMKQSHDEKGHVFFAICRGKLSEGIDLPSIFLYIFAHAQPYF